MAAVGAGMLDLDKSRGAVAGAPANRAEISNNMLSAKEPTDTALKGGDALQLEIADIRLAVAQEKLALLV